MTAILRGYVIAGEHILCRLRCCWRHWSSCCRNTASWTSVHTSCTTLSYLWHGCSSICRQSRLQQRFGFPFIIAVEREQTKQLVHMIIAPLNWTAEESTEINNDKCKPPDNVIPILMLMADSSEWKSCGGLSDWLSMTMFEINVRPTLCVWPTIPDLASMLFGFNLNQNDSSMMKRKKRKKKYHALCVMSIVCFVRFKNT